MLCSRVSLAAASTGLPCLLMFHLTQGREDRTDVSVASYLLQQDDANSTHQPCTDSAAVINQA